ncbi:hypothetical protein DFH09DRAFT_1369833 [Mycena vulgaris]|nr:hypothetical protein DFH09DRAFT_1369833 [Mycena vulgaris]
MHPSLRLSNLVQLPISIRRFASEAAKGSLDPLQRLRDLIQRERRPEEKYLACLPIFYCNLNPADIPTGDDNPACLASASALVSLNALELLHKFSPDTGFDLWPRVWPWINFIHTFRESIPKAPSEINICGELLFFIGHFCQDSRTSALITNTPGVRSLVTRAWSLIFRGEDEAPRRDQESLLALSYFIRDVMQCADPSNLEEVIEGAGGTLKDLAELVMLYIDFFVRPTHSLSSNALCCMESIFSLLVDIHDRDGPITTTLLAQGLVNSLTTAICAICAGWNNNPASVLEIAFRILRMFLVSSRSYHAIQDAVASGILRSIVLCGIRDIEHESTSDILLRILPAAAIYYSVISQMETAIQDIDGLLGEPAFVKSTIFEPWLSFQALADKRICLAKYWASPGCVTHKACDNMECGDIRPKAEFKCCRNCHRTFYCSLNCQKVDWEYGGHRARCSAMRSFRLRHREHLSPRNVSFMRALLHSDYEENKPEILRRQLAFIREHPSEQVVTVFDYAAGHVRFIVGGMSPTSFSEEGYTGIDWAEYFARASQSGGRMEFHVLSVEEGLARRWRVFPLRSNTSILHDGVRHLGAENLTSDASVQLQTLIDTSTELLVEIHS